MNKLQLIAALASSLSLVATASAQTFHLNDLEYFETRGANVLVYNNKYAGIFADEKKAGVEMILRGVRVATGGGIRLTNAPEQWDIYPEVVSRDVDKSTSTISTELRYADYDFTSVMKVRPQGNGVVVSVVLDKPVPAALEGKAGLTLEFFPASYFGTNFMMDGKPQILPHHPAGDSRMRPYSDRVSQFYGLSTFDDRGRGEYIDLHPIAEGHKLVMAPERDDLMVSISSDSDIKLFDGRNLAQNGMFVARTILPAGKTGEVASWFIETVYDPRWDN